MLTQKNFLHFRIYLVMVQMFHAIPHHKNMKKNTKNKNKNNSELYKQGGEE